MDKLSLEDSSIASAVLRRFYPALETPNLSGKLSLEDVRQCSTAVFPNVDLSSEESEMVLDYITTFTGHASQDKKQLSALNHHLATRTTLLGSKPSIADVIVYASVGPLVRAWTQEERSGERGSHHIVRFIDFVQHSPLIGLHIKEDERITIDPSQVVAKPQDLHTQDSKERKKQIKDAGIDQTSGQGMKKSNERKKSNKASTDGQPGTAPNPAKKGQQSGSGTALSPCLIDLRVGHILQAIAHPNADSLYVSTIDMGDPPGSDNTSQWNGKTVRTVCSGLNGLIPLSEMQDRKVVVVCNLKPVTMRGIKSCAMVLAASPRHEEGSTNSHDGPVELVAPPPDAPAGARVFFEGWEGSPEAVLNPKKKIWESIQPGFTTTETLEIAFDSKQAGLQSTDGRPTIAHLKVGQDFCTVKSLKNAVVR